MKRPSYYHQAVKSAFTIVELLIVIVIIAILATITIVAYNGITERSKAAVIASDLKSTEKAFTMLAIDEGRTTWWTEGELGGKGNPRISDILATKPAISSYLKPINNVAGIVGSYYNYDNDGDTITDTCSMNSSAGVNIFTNGVPQNIIKAVDKAIDDGDLACGKVRMYGGNQLQYILSSNASSM